MCSFRLSTHLMFLDRLRDCTWKGSRPDGREILHDEATCQRSPKHHFNPLRAHLRRRAWVPPRKCCSSTLRNARIFLRPVLESLGWEQPIAAEFGVPKLHRKKIICVRKKVRVCGRVVITFLFYIITPCFYAFNDLLKQQGSLDQHVST